MRASLFIVVTQAVLSAFAVPLQETKDVSKIAHKSEKRQFSLGPGPGEEDNAIAAWDHAQGIDYDFDYDKTKKMVKRQGQRRHEHFNDEQHAGAMLA
ncbi:MAG: hypothetical protein Q9214_006160 [Letrouitia sp. 1 TL-2023]